MNDPNQSATLDVSNWSFLYWAASFLLLCMWPFSFKTMLYLLSYRLFFRSWREVCRASGDTWVEGFLKRKDKSGDEFELVYFFFKVPVSNWDCHTQNHTTATKTIGFQFQLPTFYIRKSSSQLAKSDQTLEMSNLDETWVSLWNLHHRTRLQKADMISCQSSCSHLPPLKVVCFVRS